MSRVKSLHGGLGGFYNTLAAAATVNVPDGEDLFYLSGTDTVTALVASAATRGRIVTFIQGSSGTTTFTNTDDTTTANLMDLGGSNIALAATDVLCLYLTPTGSWVRIFNTNN